MGLVVAGGVEGQSAEDLAVVGEDPHVEVGDEDQDAGVFVGAADADCDGDGCGVGG